MFDSASEIKAKCKQTKTRKYIWKVKLEEYLVFNILIIKMFVRLLLQNLHRPVNNVIRRTFILGIESSCDDSGAAIIRW